MALMTINVYAPETYETTVTESSSEVTTPVTESDLGIQDYVEDSGTTEATTEDTSYYVEEESDSSSDSSAYEESSGSLTTYASSTSESGLSATDAYSAPWSVVEYVSGLTSSSSSTTTDTTTTESSSSVGLVESGGSDEYGKIAIAGLLLVGALLAGKTALKDSGGK